MLCPHGLKLSGTDRLADGYQVVHMEQHAVKVSLSGAHLATDEGTFSRARMFLILFHQTICLCQGCLGFAELAHVQRIDARQLVQRGHLNANVGALFAHLEHLPVHRYSFRDLSCQGQHFSQTLVSLANGRHVLDSSL